MQVELHKNGRSQNKTIQKSIWKNRNDFLSILNCYALHQSSEQVPVHKTYMIFKYDHIIYSPFYLEKESIFLD